MSKGIDPALGWVAPQGRYRVGARIRAYNGGGILTISPGRLALRASRPLKVFGCPVDEIVHTRSSVELYRSRVTPRVGIVLEGETDTAIAVLVSLRMDAALFDLRAAGFTTSVTRTFVSVGGERVSPWEL